VQHSAQALVVLPSGPPSNHSHLRASSKPAMLASPPTVWPWPWLMVARVGSARPPSTASLCVCVWVCV
jgi:hypothetical protein